MNAHGLDVELELTDAPDEAPQVRSLRGREAISAPFHFEVDLVLPGPLGSGAAAHLRGLVDSEASLVWRRDGVEERRVHGYIVKLTAFLEDEADHRRARIHFAPRIHRLGLVEKIEIFMDRTIPEIVEHLLALHGFEPEDFELRLRDGYPKREFVVQYAESDLAFLTRITEHVGISYFIEHGTGRDRIVFVDANEAFEKLGRSATWRPSTGPRGVRHLEATETMIPAMFAVHDYNYRTPRIDLHEQIESGQGTRGGVIEFGSHVKTLEEARQLARIRAEERDATATVYTGQGDDAAFGAGMLVDIEGHAGLEHPELLVREVEHEVEQPVLASGVLASGGAAIERTYRSTFHAIPRARAFRPPRRTPVPKVHGLLTGVIEGPEGISGEFASIDEEGRYTVRFLYDTAPPGERLASRPVRMAQPHAGAGYGIHFPLKPGTEVVLAFVNGDPDRPIIVGAVPNPLTPTPVYDANLTSNVIKTATGIVVHFKDGG